MGRRSWKPPSNCAGSNGWSASAGCCAPGDCPAGRLTMIARKEDFDAYDLAFEQWFPRARDRLRAELAGWQPEPRVSIEREIEVLVGEALSDEAGSDERDEGDEEVTIGLVASGIEMLRAKSFEDLSEAERH